MPAKFLRRSGLCICVLAVFTASLSAQAVEIYTYAGLNAWPSGFANNLNKFRTDGIYGVKAGFFLSQHSELEGSFGYMNHFMLKNPPNPFDPTFGIVQPAVRGFLYDANYAYNFGDKQIAGARLSPYVVAGAGGLTAHIPDAQSIFLLGGGSVIGHCNNGSLIPNPSTSIVMDTGDTFFTLNYGGGVKMLRVWGPMGFRGDLRGRTFPNFYGETTTWFEPTVGLTFSWGER